MIDSLAQSCERHRQCGLLQHAKKKKRRERERSKNASSFLHGQPRRRPDGSFDGDDGGDRGIDERAMKLSALPVQHLRPSHLHLHQDPGVSIPIFICSSPSSLPCALPTRRRRRPLILRLRDHRRLDGASQTHPKHVAARPGVVGPQAVSTGSMCLGPVSVSPLCSNSASCSRLRSGQPTVLCGRTPEVV